MPHPIGLGSRSLGCSLLPRCSYRAFVATPPVDDRLPFENRSRLSTWRMSAKLSCRLLRGQSGSRLGGRNLMADIVLINPRFEPSYWGLEHALPVIGAKAVLPGACLPLLAALAPGEDKGAVFDEYIEPIDFERCARSDIVRVTGMLL